MQHIHLRKSPVAASTLRRLAWFATLGAMLAGCTSSDGGGGGDLDIGSGQAPDAATVDFPIAYVKRPVPVNPPDARRMLPFLEGGDLYVRDRASPSAPERNVTFEITQGLGDVRDVEPSWDGRKLVFAMRAPLIEGAPPEEQPTWNLWEYEVATRTLARLIVSDTIAEDGHDFAPHYLPDGRIVFSSTRQRVSRAVLLDEGKPQFAALEASRTEHAFVLHVMNADGSNIRQLSFNQSHDLDPAVLADGRVVFSRWDNAGGPSAMHLYTVNPDGTGMELLYGAESHATGTDGATVQFLDPRPMPDGRVLALVRPYSGTELGGDLLAIDVANYANLTQPTRPNVGVLAGPAQQPVTANVVTTIPGPSPGGRFSAAYPLDDGTGRILVSWTQCRLLEAGRIVPCTDERLAAAAPQPAPPLYGVWMYDPRESTQLPVVPPVEGTMVTDVVALQPRALPAVRVDQLPAPGLETRLAEADTGLLDIRSIYDVAGVDTSVATIAVLADPARTTAAQRPARFVRIEKAVGLPDDEVLELPGFAFGVSAAQGMREIIGYAPVEPDGSVRVQVPAGVPLAITVLDANGRRISPRHLNWLQVQAGEIVSCNGCHTPAEVRSHGRRDLFEAANPGATTTGLPFPNTVDAIFADFGETMAQARGRISCQDDCASMRPTVDLVFEDVWTDPVKAGRPADDPVAYRYADLGTLAPVGADCQAAWSATCRVVIHYEAHLHPLWGLPRQTFDVMGMLVSDHTCTSCHTTVDAAAAPRVPAGQLDLTDGPSEVNGQFKSYRELLAGDAEQALVDGVLQDRLVQTGVDAQGLPVFSTVPVRASMSAAGARASVTFFSKFAAGGSHAGWLSAAELRLVSEWLDVGAQYFNDPFAVPVD